MHGCIDRYMVASMSVCMSICMRVCTYEYMYL